MGGQVLKRYVLAMADSKRSEDAYQGIVFMNELSSDQEVVDVALQVGQISDLTSSQKQTLNSMFSSSSKWTMLQ